MSSSGSVGGSLLWLMSRYLAGPCSLLYTLWEKPLVCSFQGLGATAILDLWPQLPSLNLAMSGQVLLILLSGNFSLFCLLLLFNTFDDHTWPTWLIQSGSLKSAIGILHPVCYRSSQCSHVTLPNIAKAPGIRAWAKLGTMILFVTISTFSQTHQTPNF